MQRWKDAATLILVAGTKLQMSSFNYQALMLERSTKSKFMPSATVFPGGILDKSDYCNEWLEIFRAAGVYDFTDLTNIAGPRPEVFTKTRSSMVPSEVAFRICAIRETFEESGILLARRWQEGNNTTIKTDSDDIELRWWQTKVDDDSNQFLAMCRERCIVPDIWSLSEWSNWLTPTEMLNASRAGRRYDTMFFISTLDVMPETAHCRREMVSAKWYSPQHCIELFHKKHLWLAPPQYYELSRLLNFYDINKLGSFHHHRNNFGCERWLPIILFCQDGRLSLLPGDDRYPKEEAIIAMPNKTQDTTQDTISESSSKTQDTSQDTIAESSSKTTNQHCLEIRGPYRYKMTVNIQPKCDHVSPIGSCQHTPYSQL